MRLVCEICSFSTIRRNDYSRHISTEKHLNNIKTFNETKAEKRTCENPREPVRTRENPREPVSTQLVIYDNNMSVNNLSSVKICEYCSLYFNSSKHIINHQITSCIKIPEIYKNRLIRKHNRDPRAKNKLELVFNSQRANTIVNNNINIDNKNIKVDNNNNINIDNSKIDNTNNNINIDNSKIDNNNINIDNSKVDNNINIDNKNIKVDNNSNHIHINSFGNESLDHITFEDYNNIINGDTNLMALLCSALYKEKSNTNTYLDVRKNLAFYLDDDKTIKIARTKKFIQKFCNIYMNKMKDIIVKNPDKFERINKLVFDATFAIFFCIVNKDNIDDMDIIEKEHNELIQQFNDDVKLALLNANKQSKQTLNTITNNFNKL